jgi:hypothetical protein
VPDCILPDFRRQGRGTAGSSARFVPEGQLILARPLSVPGKAFHKWVCVPSGRPKRRAAPTHGSHGDHCGSPEATEQTSAEHAENKSDPQITRINTDQGDAELYSTLGTRHLPLTPSRPYLRCRASGIHRNYWCAALETGYPFMGQHLRPDNLQRRNDVTHRAGTVMAMPRR